MSETVELTDALELLGDGAGFKDELCAMIEGTQMFSDFTRSEVETLARYTRAYKAEKGKLIFREGEKGAYMCIVIDGKVDIVKENLERERKKISTVRAGRSMGEMSIIDEMPHSASAIAAEPVTLVMIPKYSFERLTSDHPGLALKIIKKLAKLLSLRLRQTTGTLLDYL